MLKSHPKPNANCFRITDENCENKVAIVANKLKRILTFRTQYRKEHFFFFSKFLKENPSWTLLPPPSPYHPSGSSQCTSPKHPASCIEPGLAFRFIHDISHVSMPFSQILPPSPSHGKEHFWPVSGTLGLFPGPRILDLRQSLWLCLVACPMLTLRLWTYLMSPQSLA